MGASLLAVANHIYYLIKLHVLNVRRRAHLLTPQADIPGAGGGNCGV